MSIMEKRPPPSSQSAVFIPISLSILGGIYISNVMNSSKGSHVSGGEEGSV
jgi:hypothetical protein